MELSLNHQCACANCGHVIDYRSSEAGSIIKCPKCGEESQLPEAEKLALQQPHGPSAPEFRKCEVSGSQIKTFAAICPVCDARQKRQIFHRRIKITVGAL